MYNEIRIVQVLITFKIGIAFQMVVNINMKF